jgi:4-azaleucine resistance transporter AzlC
MKTYTLRTGIAASLPIVLGYLPVAMTFGVVAREAGLQVHEALLLSGIIFAGAGQFALIGLLATGTPAGMLLLTIFALNLRHLLYGPLLSPFLQRASTGRSLLIAFGLTDEVFAAAFARLAQKPEGERVAWLAGLEVGAYLAWLAGTAIGAGSGDLLVTLFPQMAAALAFALPVLFLVLLLPLLEGEVTVAVLVAAVVAGLFQFAGYPTPGILAAGLAGPLAGLLWRRRACR